MTNIYLIPTFISEDNLDTLPANTVNVIKLCTAVFAENIRTTRRFFKKIHPEIVIDDIEWHEIHKAEQAATTKLDGVVKKHEHVAIVSEAGCPGLADPGQLLVAKAHQISNVKVIPLTGPSSVLLALMASGLGGQKFTFNGYLPIDANPRKAAIVTLSKRVSEQQVTQIFMETPYRNTTMITDLLRYLPGNLKLCIASNITSSNEWIKTMYVQDWRTATMPDLHKQPCIFIIG